MRKSLWVSVVLLVATMVIVPACKAPAEFEVAALEVVPPEVTAGDQVSVTVKVKNTGGSEGVYTAILAVDGATVETKEVTLAPDVTEVIRFSLVRDKAGTYQVVVGDLSSSLTVKPRLVAKRVELKYDNGEARDCISALPTICDGYLVDFTPPSVPFKVNSVRIYGVLACRGDCRAEDFEVEIWDKDHKVLHSVTYPVTGFTRWPTNTWVEVEVPAIEVSDKFYVHVYTGTGIQEGIHIGADDTVTNEHSNYTLRMPGGTTRILTEWPLYRTYWFGDKSKVNWMIRVVGTVMVPAE